MRLAGDCEAMLLMRAASCSPGVSVIKIGPPERHLAAAWSELYVGRDD